MNDSMTVQECLGAITAFVEREPSVTSIQDTLRLARIRLGAVIDRLEALEASHGALDELHYHADSIMLELDNLLGAISQNGCKPSRLV